MRVQDGVDPDDSGVYLSGRGSDEAACRIPARAYVIRGSGVLL